MILRYSCYQQIDLPSADPDRVKHEIEDIIGLDASEAVLCFC